VIRNGSAGATIAEYCYVGRGRVERRDHGNGTRAEFDYDDDRRIAATRHRLTSTGAVFDNRTYGWDAVGNKTSRSSTTAPNVGERTFAYDSAYRMTQSTGGVFGGATYDLDGVGNRTQVVNSGGADHGLYTMSAAGVCELFSTSWRSGHGPNRSHPGAAGVRKPGFAPSSGSNS
jgi:hypothetical protein